MATDAVTWDDDGVVWDDAPKKRTFTEDLLRQAGLFARIPVHAAAGTVGVLTDAATGLYNTAADKIGAGGPRFPPTTTALNNVMDMIGLPKPEGPLENLVQFGGTMLGGGADPALKGLQQVLPKAPAAFQDAKTAMRSTIQELNKAGIKLPPSVMGGKVTGVLEGIGGGAHTAATAQVKSQPAIQKMAAAETGLDYKNLTEAALDQASKQVALEGYAPVKNFGTFRLFGNNPISKFGGKLDAIAKKYDSLDQTPQIHARINTLRERTLPSEAVIERSKQLRADASDAFRKDNTNYGRALREMATALEDQIERNLPAGSDILTNFRAARVQLAKNNAVKDMLVDPNTGLVSSAKAAKLREHGEKLTGKLETIAKAGSDVFKQATDAPIQGEKPPLNLGDAAYFGGGGAVGGLIGSLFGGPPGIALGSLLGTIAVPALRSGARSTVLSKPVQDMLARGPQPSIFGDAAPLVKAGMAPPLFSMGEQ